MDDIAYTHACSLAKEALPKIANDDAKLLHQQHTIQYRSLAQLVDYVDQSVEQLNTDVKTAFTSFAIVCQVHDLDTQQTKLQTTVFTLTDKVSPMDSKLDLLLSVLLYGANHDAKKGEKSEKEEDDESKGNNGNKEKKTSDATKQSTHVFPSEQTRWLGQVHQILISQVLIKKQWMT